MSKKIKFKKNGKKMNKKIKSYIVKKNATVSVIRFNNPNKLSDGHYCIEELKTPSEFGFESSYVIAKCNCPCCDEVSYIFNHMHAGPVEIHSKDLILTKYSIEKYYRKQKTIKN